MRYEPFYFTDRTLEITRSSNMPAIGELYRHSSGSEWEVATVDFAVAKTVTLQPRGGGEQKTVTWTEFSNEYSYSHPGAARTGYDGN